MNQVILFEGTVRKVEADTTGWGDGLRTVGVAVTLQVRGEDSDGSYEKETVIHLPKRIAQPQVGDLLVVQVAQPGIEDLVSESELAELPPIPEPGDEDVPDEGYIVGDELAGEPYHDEIKQGG
jgi:hypothetical protein